MGAKVWKRTEKGGSQSYVVGIQTNFKDKHHTYHHPKRYPQSYPQSFPHPYSYQRQGLEEATKQTLPNNSSSSSNTTNAEPKDRVEEETQQNTTVHKNSTGVGTKSVPEMAEIAQQSTESFLNQSDNFLSSHHDQMMDVPTVQDVRQIRGDHNWGAKCDQNWDVKNHGRNGYSNKGARTHRPDFRSRRHNNNQHYFNQSSCNQQSFLNQAGQSDTQDQIHSKQDFIKKLKMQQKRYEGAREEVLQLKQQVQQLEEAILLQRKRKAEQELNEHEERKQRLRSKLQRSFAKQFEQAAEVGQVKREAEERERQRQEVWALIQRISSAKDPYEVLGVDKNIVQDMDVQVRSSFKKLAVVLHPDKCSFPEATEAFRKVRNAYNALQSKLVQ
eukprot:TRINITY_DN912_c0_g1_i1.p1 TRINITY_DN912_c0_g1~~TRINITY_DN912_c0_g1_i1.p1  ORF type:complete len:386 (-),score=56.54 TRINITY_DN912_c0_g1_i1:222-1379(-)